MARATYTIVDEPAPSGLNHLAVHPQWPVLALMLGGGWIGWPWLVLNAFAFGSATRYRELAYAVAAVVGVVLLAVLFGGLIGTGALPEAARPYTLIVLIGWKMVLGYLVYLRQLRSFGVYEYYGGPVKNGMAIAVLSAFARGLVMKQLPAALTLVAM